MISLNRRNPERDGCDACDTESRSHLVRRVVSSYRGCLALVFFAAYLAVACNPHSLSAQDEDGDQQAQVEFFEKQVRPLLIDRCYECHAGDEQEGGLLLDSRLGWLTGGDSGPPIIPGDPEASLLIHAVRYKNLDLQMPPQGRLEDSEIEALVRWVEMGAPDPRVASPENGREGNAGPVGMSIEEGRQFWSLQPPRQSRLPEVKNSAWIQTPIDAFILARLEAQGLQPAPPADRPTLIRRVTLDLIGVPPTPAEIEAFVNDESPEAWEKVIDRLLASPQYGERWGRHWLDVARYADSNGLDENLAFGNAWRYRDYVIASFNEGKPYDQFILEQIAGDLLPNANRTTKTATGFLVLGAKVLAEPDTEKLIVDTIDEQIDTTGKAFLGLTLGCARCHDHKFDPIKQSDYYGLAAIFKSTRTFGDTKTGVIKHWYEHSFATEEEHERIKQVDAEIAAKNKIATDFKNTAMAELRRAARDRATNYLIAATEIQLGMSLNEIEQVALRHDVHPRILHHCRQHLEFHREDSFFQPWFEFTAQDDLDGLRDYYARLFEAAREPATSKSTAEENTAEENSEDASSEDAQSEEDRAWEDYIAAARAALNDSSGFLAVPAQPQYAFDLETLAEYERLLDEARRFESAAEDAAAAMGVTDGDVVEEIPLHIRGSHTNLGEPVSRRIPTVFVRHTDVDFQASQSGRLALAKWVVRSDHPLTARVHVNRVWGWHFGQGLVRTTENFGVLGDPPSHPALLDWLAVEFVQSGWSTKQLHRLILLSNTYRMSGMPGPTLETVGLDPAEIDPANRLLWKFPLQRMSAEQVRDSILSVAGCLDQAIGGKTIPLRNRQFVFNHTSQDHTKYDSRRRAVYLPIVRNHLDPFLEQFDYPDPTMPTGDRSTTVVAPQTLILMNSEFVMRAADEMAIRLLAIPEKEQRVRSAYQTAFGRLPSDLEISRAIRFVDDVRSQLLESTPVNARRSDAGARDDQSSDNRSRDDRSGDDSQTEDRRLEVGDERARQAELLAWSMFCQGIFASNEFIFVR